MTQIELMYVAFITNLQVNDPRNLSIARVTNCCTLFSVFNSLHTLNYMALIIFAFE
jgi:hypothetical protein